MKGEARKNKFGDKKQLDKVPHNLPGVEGALDYLMRVVVKDTLITRPEKIKSSDSRSSKCMQTKRGKKIEIDKNLIDKSVNKRSDTYGFRRNPKPT